MRDPQGTPKTTPETLSSFAPFPCLSVIFWIVDESKAAKRGKAEGTRHEGRETLPAAASLWQLAADTYDC